MFSRCSWTIAAIGLCATILCLVGWIVIADAAAPYDGDLRPRRLPSLAQDSFPIYLSAAGAVVLPSSAPLLPIAEYWQAPDPIYFVLVDSNRKAVDLVTKALTLGLRLPERLRLEDPVPSLFAARNLAILLVHEGERLESLGESHKAMASRLAAVKLGHVFSAENADISSFCMGTSMRQTGFEAIRYRLASSRLDEDDLQWLRSELQSLRITDSMVAEVVRREYSMSALLCDEHENYAAIALFFKPNATKQRLAEFHRELIADIGRLPSDRRISKLVREKSGSSLLGFVRANTQGEAFAAFATSIGYLSAFDEARYWDRAMDTLIAIHLFHRRTGRLPASLVELVPNELDALPLDPFDGQPLRYDAQRRTISTPRYPVWGAIAVEIPATR